MGYNIVDIFLKFKRMPLPVARRQTQLSLALAQNIKRQNCINQSNYQSNRCFKNNHYIKAMSSAEAGKVVASSECV